MASAPILITADEVNCLIYSYFQDSGFQHSAFSLRSEGRLDQSPNFQKRIPRGELVELLSKALLYTEVETHWRESTLTTNCKTGFSLLEDHVCSEGSSSKQPVNFATSSMSSSLSRDVLNMRTPEDVDMASKRKASTPATDDGRSDKRARKDRGTETPIQESTSQILDGESMSEMVLFDSAAKKLKHARSPAHEEDEPDPLAIRLLSAHATEVFVCAWNPTLPHILASGSKDAIVHLWNLPILPKDSSAAPPAEPLTLAYYPKEDQGDLTSLDWNSDGSLLAIGSYDAILRVCTSTGELYFSNPKHQGPIFATRFSKSGKWLLTASLDSSACVWNVKEKKLHKEFRSHSDCCLDVDWVDDETFASCGADRVIHIMSLSKEGIVKSFKGHENEINQIKFNPTRTRLASCSDDKTARIWKSNFVKGVFSDECVVLEGHRGHVSGVSWCPAPSPEGHELIATSSFDNTSRLWDAETGACLKVFSNHKRPIYTITFSPDGHWLATGSGDGWMHVYDVKEREKVWSWRSESPKRGIFEIDWQKKDNFNRIALALESKKVAVVDVTRLPALQRYVAS
ncbi:WD40 repeat-like protein [Dentipellis sp. KUC8613]|nr:WD40 repeat-like protein [Dentipellis sp. KUC8613]